MKWKNANESRSAFHSSSFYFCRFEHNFNFSDGGQLSTQYCAFINESENITHESWACECHAQWLK